MLFSIFIFLSSPSLFFTRAHAHLSSLLQISLSDDHTHTLWSFTSIYSLFIRLNYLLGRDAIQFKCDAPYEAKYECVSYGEARTSFTYNMLMRPDVCVRMQCWLNVTEIIHVDAFVAASIPRLFKKKKKTFFILSRADRTKEGANEKENALKGEIKKEKVGNSSCKMWKIYYTSAWCSLFIVVIARRVWLLCHLFVASPPVFQ